MKRCSISIVIRKKKIKTAIRYNFTPMRMAIKKKQTENEIASVVQDVEELKSSSSADGNDGLKCYSHYGKLFGHPTEY